MNASFMSFNYRLSNWLGSEGICLNQYFRFSFAYFFNDGICTATIRAEIDMGCGVERDIYSIGTKYKQIEDDNGIKKFFHF